MREIWLLPTTLTKCGLVSLNHHLEQVKLVVRFQLCKVLSRYFPSLLSMQVICSFLKLLLQIKFSNWSADHGSRSSRLGQNKLGNWDFYPKIFAPKLEIWRCVIVPWDSTLWELTLIKAKTKMNRAIYLTRKNNTFSLKCFLKERKLCDKSYFLKFFLKNRIKIILSPTTSHRSKISNLFRNENWIPFNLSVWN